MGRRKRALPPDPENMNEDRAMWGGNAIRSIMADTGTERDTALPDLLADLMHWADREPGIDFDAALDTARGHYAAETADELTR